MIVEDAKTLIRSNCRGARTELWHIGEISGMRDPDLQYAYAQSTVNSMMHLHDAMAELLDIYS